MSPYPKFIDVRLTGGRTVCFVINEQGTHYSTFTLPVPAVVMCLSIASVEELIRTDSEIVNLSVHN